MTQEPQTYVLFTNPKMEEKTASILNDKILHRYPGIASRIYVPKAIRMWHKTDNDGNKYWEERITPLFHSYVFFESSDIVSLCKILNDLRIITPYHISGKNNIGDKGDIYDQYPIVPVNPEDMARINGLLGENGIAEKSTFIKEGSHVEFRSGPLKGKEADVKKIFPSKHFAIMEMEFLGEKRRVSMAVQKICRDTDTI